MVKLEDETKVVKVWLMDFSLENLGALLFQFGRQSKNSAKSSLYEYLLSLFLGGY